MKYVFCSPLFFTVGKNVSARLSRNPALRGENKHKLISSGYKQVTVHRRTSTGSANSDRQRKCHRCPTPLREKTTRGLSCDGLQLRRTRLHWFRNTHKNNSYLSGLTPCPRLLKTRRPGTVQHTPIYFWNKVHATACQTAPLKERRGISANRKSFIL